MQTEVNATLAAEARAFDRVARLLQRDGIVVAHEPVRFEQRRFQWRYAFFYELIDGLHFDEPLSVAPAHYLREIDRELCRLGVLSATEFFFVGRLKSH